MASGAVVLLVVALVGGALWHLVNHLEGQLRDKIGGAVDLRRSALHESAVADAAEKVDRVLFRFEYDHLYQADKYAHSAGQHSDVKVLAVSGETHWQTGVSLVLQVAGHGVEIGADGSVINERDEQICFRIQLGPENDTRDNDIPCPTGAPVPVTKDPSLAGVDDRLKSALQPAGSNEAAVRAAIVGLRLDPAIRQDIAAREGTVGIALRASQYDCILARVTSKGAELWRPSHTQLAPGEMSCTAETALSSAFGKYPH
ncbi:hypothetical protein DKT68_07605 [Micromonospora acroterricola]|uniref:Uncharacterized protein n=1 Tax=Micromonospora acroterricola TaxID=2202421 RepID=A0A317D8I2_9ACTN|nr:hypothetical protein [Micromonospora acroterricola]PWR10887.1 hypothetical protein DKT68_07605 [Micromonospora acroterricola]